ncbi:MAG: hypothetical protein ACJAUH_000774 [Saprospiraceae bacterium]
MILDTETSSAQALKSIGKAKIKNVNPKHQLRIAKLFWCVYPWKGYSDSF